MNFTKYIKNQENSISPPSICSSFTVAGTDSYMPGQMPGGGMQDMYSRAPSALNISRSQYPYGPGYDRRYAYTLRVTAVYLFHLNFSNIRSQAYDSLLLMDILCKNLSVVWF